MKTNNLDITNLTFENESQILSALKKQISLFNVFFDRLSILTKSVDYNNCDIIVFDSYPFDIEINELSKYIDVWSSFFIKKNSSETNTNLLEFYNKNYLGFISDLTPKQYSLEIQHVLNEILTLSNNINYLFKLLPNCILNEIIRRFYPFDLTFDNVNKDIKIWVKNIKQIDS